MPFRRLVAVVLLCLAAPRAAAARVVRVVVDRREPVADGAAFGSAGAYERLVGRVFFAFDPNNPHDRQIVDLALAPRNAAGEVEAWAEFTMLRPADPSRGSGVTLLDVVNRGNMTVGVFHLDSQRGASPTSAGYFGDALLLRRGLTVVTLGWQWDILPGDGPMHFHPPVAGDPAHPITGLVRSDITVDTPTDTIPLGHRVGASQALGYAASDPDDASNVLTVRDGPTAPRTVVPRARWHFTADRTAVTLDGGFTPGKIYEVVYRAANPVVVGTGLAAVRDMISWLKHDPASLAPTRWGIAYGVSQTGRFLRHFLYQGFDVDEQGRLAFDGIFAHTAGAGRGSFNHRFAQPSRDAQPYSTFFYPTDVFPFTSLPETDPVTGARGALRSAAVTKDAAPAPKVFYVDGGYEYWGRAASLAHTTPDGARDVGFLPSERRYVINSAQHSSPGPFPPNARLDSGPAWKGSPLDQRLALRALLVALVEWVKDGREPPPSMYPTLAARALMPVDSLRRPAIPGVALARVPYQPYRLDLAKEPPTVGTPYTVLVPRVDSLGNDLGGIRSVELRAALATYFPWQLRLGMPAGADRLVSFQGTVVPLPRTEAERAQRGDPRPSIERLYGSRDAYLARVDAAARALVAERFMLPEDAAAAHARLAATWDWIMR
ncbi:hypothetical protein J421_4762 (plasmid) [Gemmatirosa kalamazoonensis]|uniref:Alpha/beta hydrolase domain-containing protein n=1 Tax=Gemmatirosa kalamazoonensis TaxID=861299 RepID=W0RP85_9BACT|nr:alpha/beta hydrolase domain-containing protein [Gemmatirosa kalamazoonensis]AHG92297.1 hypothetical protein J421_4762 [Gemmatirosa kalamazoonensis]